MQRATKWISGIVAASVMAVSCASDFSEIDDSSDIAASSELAVPAEVPQATLATLRSSAVAMLDENMTKIKSTLKVPAEVVVEQKSCDGDPNAFWDPRARSITMCDELFAEVARLWFDPARTAEENSVRVLGAWAFVFFHEVGHGLSDVFQLPLTGREEDAVDDFSSLFLIRAGLSDAALSAAGFWLNKSSDPSMLTLPDFLDEHSLNEQRFGAIMCLLYGSDPERFEAITTKFGFTERRQTMCKEEFRRKNTAWEQILAPFEREAR